MGRIRQKIYIFVENELPRPVLHDKEQIYDADTPVRVWFEKLQEEVMEAHEQAIFFQMLGDDDSHARLAEELTDIKNLCETYLSVLGYDAFARKDLQKRVNQKNQERGYFEPMKKDGEGK